jgi:hypothetical protein
MKYMAFLLCMVFVGCHYPSSDFDGRAISAVEIEKAHKQNEGTEVVPDETKVPRKECKTCNGTGLVRTGDGQGWQECDKCYAVTGEAPFVIPMPEPAPEPVEQETSETPETKPEEQVKQENPQEEQVVTVNVPCCELCQCGDNCKCEWSGQCLVNHYWNKTPIGSKEVVIVVEEKSGYRTLTYKDPDESKIVGRVTTWIKDGKWSNFYKSVGLTTVKTAATEPCSIDCICGKNCKCTYPGECLVNFYTKKYGPNIYVKVTQCHGTWCEDARIYKAPGKTDFEGEVHCVKTDTGWGKCKYKKLVNNAVPEYMWSY